MSQAAELERLIDFEAGFLASERADRLLAELLNSPHWDQPELQLYGRRHPIPRLQQWLGDAPHQYTYSGQVFEAHPWPASIATLAQELSDASGVKLNSVLINCYRSGQDTMGWHADDEPELGPAPVIATISLGASRDMAFRPVGSSRQAAKIELTHCSLLLMKAGLQTRFQHAIPKRARVNEPRVSLTFRQILTTE